MEGLLIGHVNCHLTICLKKADDSQMFDELGLKEDIG